MSGWQPYGPPGTSIPPKKPANVGVIIAAIASVVLLLCVGAAIAAGILIGRSFGGFISVAEATFTAQAATANAVQTSSAGGTLTASNGVSCTLLSANILPASAYDKPTVSDELVLVQVRLVNTSNEDEQYSEGDFNVENSSGDLVPSQTIHTPGYAELLRGTLAPGGTVTGYILFDATAGDHQLRLTWQPDQYGAKTANSWALGL
jgi:hypothetical protein